MTEPDPPQPPATAPITDVDSSTLDYSSPTATARAEAGRRSVMALGVVGLIVGLACVVLAIGLSGFGHGWNAPFSVSWVAGVTSPLAGAAWTMRRRSGGKGLALLLLVGALLADAALRKHWRDEGPEYFQRAWSGDAGTVVARAALWASWQLLAVASLLWPAARRVRS